MYLEWANNFKIKSDLGIRKIGYFSFERQTFSSRSKFLRLLLIWSRTHSVPGHLVPLNWSPRTNSPGSFGPRDNWSPWTIGPQTFGPHGQMVPRTIGPPGQMVPKHLVPMDKWSPKKLVPMDNWSPKFFDIGWSTLDIMDDFKPKKSIYVSVK